MSVGESPHNYKVVLLGKHCVGKTSIVLRYTDDKFNNEHLSTIQASFLNKKINIDGKRVNLAIWDTAGQEQFHALGPLYYRSSNGAVIVYDITDQISFKKVKSWVKELRKMLGTEISLVIVGNKTDLESDRQVDLEEAEAYAKNVGAIHWQTSAKENEGVEDMFLALIEKMMEKESQLQQQAGASLAREGSQRRRTLILDDEQGETVQRNCCSSQ